MLLGIALLAPKLLTKSLRDFFQYPLRGEKQVTYEGWSLSVTCRCSFTIWIPSRIDFSITTTYMCIKCTSSINSSGLSITCCQDKSNHTANISIVIQPFSETAQNVLGKAFDPFLVL